MTLIELIIERQNLVAAWIKVKSCLLGYEGWVGIKDLYLFEATLDQNLQIIHDQFVSGEWQLQKMMPLPRLKVSKDRKTDREAEIIRQDFWVPIIDQVAWVAMVNVIGEILDVQMPGWSFANRLYRSVFYEDIDLKGDKQKFRVGPYRHATGNLYRKWHTSWNLYRRLSYFSWLHMRYGDEASKTISGLADGDQITYNSYNNPELSAEEKQGWGVQYLDKGYWENPCGKSYWTKIDFTNFYPSLKRESILSGIKYGLENFCEHDDIKRMSTDKVVKLVEQMLKFCWIDPDWSADEKNWAYLNDQGRGIPVGLLVSGFLSNVALLPIEKELENMLKLQSPRRIAHFRYVDDHLFLSSDQTVLISWIRDYILLIKRELGVKINLEKTDPQVMNKYIAKHERKFNEQEDLQSITIDPQNPKQFITRTIALVSDIANKDFGLLHLNEQESLMDELRYLLKIPVQEDEIRNDTRMTFAIYRIIRLIIDWQHDFTAPLFKQRDIAEELYKHVKDGSLDKYEDYEVKELYLRISSGNNSLLNEEIYQKQVIEGFNNLINTIKQFPERLRLWRLVVEFCRHTGYCDYKEMQNIFKDKDKRQYTFLKTLIWLELGKSILESSRVISKAKILSSNLFSWQIEAQNKFINTVDDWVNILSLGPNDEEYAKIAWSYLHDCIELGKLIRENDSNSLSFDNPGSLYWAEMMLTDIDSTEPSKLWLKNISQLNYNDSIARSLMKMYPKELKQLSPDKFKKVVFSLDSKNNSWEWEGNNFTRIKEGINLVDWAEWGKIKQDWCNQNGIYDPRISEWTSLEIIKRIVDIYRGTLEKNPLKQIREIIVNTIIPHPANFYLPAGVDKEEKSLTWETWDKKIEEYGRKFVKLVSKKYLVKLDNRISPFWLSAKERNQNQRMDELLYGIGLLLLGLLRKDFSWPSRWNLPGYTSDWRNIGKNWFNSFACSTNTLAILEVLLLPRHRESKRIELKKEIQYKFYKDTLYDPDTIYDLPGLYQKIVTAQKTLENNRISSFEAKPRQLVPVTIRDLIKRPWLKIEE